MKEELRLLVDHLKEVVNERHNEGVKLNSISSALSEWNFGYAEGLDYTIEKIENLINRLQEKAD